MSAARRYVSLHLLTLCQRTWPKLKQNKHHLHRLTDQKRGTLFTGSYNAAHIFISWTPLVKVSTAVRTSIPWLQHSAGEDVASPCDATGSCLSRNRVQAVRNRDTAGTCRTLCGASFLYQPKKKLKLKSISIFMSYLAVNLYGCLWGDREECTQAQFTAGGYL